MKKKRMLNKQTDYPEESNFSVNKNDIQDRITGSDISDESSEYLFMH
jgi:hypothetical protein